MEDLVAGGAEWGHATRPLGRPALERVLGYVADLHAATWESKELEETSWIQSIDAGPLFESFKARTAESLRDNPRLELL